MVSSSCFLPSSLPLPDYYRNLLFFLSHPRSLFTEHSLCARHCAKRLLELSHFTTIMSELSRISSTTQWNRYNCYPCITARKPKHRKEKIVKAQVCLIPTCFQHDWGQEPFLRSSCKRPADQAGQVTCSGVQSLLPGV